MASPPNRPATTTLTWLAAVAIGGGLLATRGAGLEDLDSANFALALGRYDLAHHMPHFPGYPVYVAATRVAHAAGADTVLSLQLPGILTWAACLPLLHRAIRAWFGPAVATITLLLLALSPLPWLTAGRAGSDAMGFALLCASGASMALGAHPDEAHAGRLRAIGGLLAGLTLGVRLSYAPAILGLLALSLLRGASWRAHLGWLAGGVALWAVPFTAITHAELIAHAQTFLTGHFLVWGGTAWVEGAEAAGLSGRAMLWATNLWTHALGLPTEGASTTRWLLLPLLLAGSLSAARSLTPRHWVNLSVALVPYLLWLWLGQNPDKPRHLLPLLPTLALATAIGLARLPRPAQALPISLLAITLPLAIVHAQVPSPAAQLANWLNGNARPDQVQIFTGQSERVVYASFPAFRVEYAPDMAEVHRRLAHWPTPPPVLMWTDDIPDWEESPRGYGPPRPVTAFLRDPAVNPHRASLGLWTADRVEEIAIHTEERP